MADQLGILPTTLIAGESINETLTGLTLSGSLVYTFGATTPVEVTCTDDGTSFELAVSAIQTLTFGYGSIKYSAMQTVGAVVSCVDYGTITVSASPSATSNYTATLAAVDTAIANYATNANKKIKVGEIEIEYRNLSELMSLRSFYSNLIAKDTGRGARGGPYKIYSRFV